MKVWTTEETGRQWCLGDSWLLWTQHQSSLMREQPVWKSRPLNYINTADTLQAVFPGWIIIIFPFFLIIALLYLSSHVYGLLEAMCGSSLGSQPSWMNQSLLGFAVSSSCDRLSVHIVPASAWKGRTNHPTFLACSFIVSVDLSSFLVSHSYFHSALLPFPPFHCHC